MDEYRTRKRGDSRFQARLPESRLLHPARRFLPRVLHYRVAVVAPIFSAAGQGRQSAIHDSPSQSRLREPSALRALSDVWRVRLADESELPLVLDHVRRLHFRGRGRQFDGASRPRDHRTPTRRLSQERGHARALSHHGEVDVRLLRFLGLHRVRSIHAHLVREHARGDAILSNSEYGIVVELEHAARDRPLLRAVRHFAVALNQKTSAPALLRRRLDFIDADARHLSRGLAGAAWNRHAREPMGFRRAHRHWRDVGVRLLAHRWKNFALSSPRPAPGRVFEISELKWPIPNNFNRPRRFRPGSALSSCLSFSA